MQCSGYISKSYASSTSRFKLACSVGEWGMGNDVIVLGQSFDEHLDNLRAVFERFRANNLKLKPRKCELFRRQLKSLG